MAMANALITGVGERGRLALGPYRVFVTSVHFFLFDKGSFLQSGLFFATWRVVAYTATGS
jgi:hypothetical protein